MNNVVSQAQWLAARKKLLAEEKAFTRVRDQLSQSRRSLPHVKVETDYRFDGEQGECSLLDLFGSYRQLIVYHFMYGVDYEVGCKTCSFWMDGLATSEVHLRHRDVAFKVVSKAPSEVLQTFRQRMGWPVQWFSTGKSTFNEDFGVSFAEVAQDKKFYNYRQTTAQGELPGVSVFLRGDDDTVYHTYSCYARGLDILNTAYNLLDITPVGRNEDELGHTTEWVRLHDEY